MQISKKAVIILPTYNEIENIGRLLDSIQEQQHRIADVELSVVVVDDSSPDGTGEFVKDYSRKYSNVSLLNGTGKLGLGSAYIRGFKYAIETLNADVVFEMDADFSHNPHDIPRLLQEALKGSDFVIGSRYIEGGSIPHNWSWIRKLNSKWGNIFARYVAGLQDIKDCTSGYRAIKASLLKKINLEELGVKGYAFQMNLLHEAVTKEVVVKELPIHFTDRQYGKSKLRIKDIREFVLHAFLIRFPFLRLIPIFLIAFFIGLLLGGIGIAIYTLLSAGVITGQTLIIFAVASLSILLSFQSIFSIYWMLYAWEDAERMEADAPPKKYSKPKQSFSAIIPARHEEKVIEDTIIAVSNINYPEELKELIIVCRCDDALTISKAKEAMELLGKNNTRLVIFDDSPINKPHSLNIGLKHATKNNIVIFDAEDQPHKDIYNIVNSILEIENADVVQAGVQLMNFRSSWFSSLNVLEYFFWFKSTLHFFSKIGIIPLGGNTVFFKKTRLEQVGGWDENCLTEDADIGIRLSALGAKVRVVYSEEHVTQEETPTDVASFIRQRTRWNQGFIQVLLKGDWLKLPRLTQKFLALYILVLPQIQALLFMLIPLSIITVLTLKLPVGIALLAFIPLLLMILQLVIYNVGLYEFTKSYKLTYPLYSPLKILYTFYPFQLLIGFSSLRALIRLIAGHAHWEKTQHVNAHRPLFNLEPADFASTQI